MSFLAMVGWRFLALVRSLAIADFFGVQGGQGVHGLNCRREQACQRFKLRVWDEACRPSIYTDKDGGRPSITALIAFQI